MNELIVTAMIIMIVVLLLETFITLFAIRANNEAYERYIAEIKINEDLNKKIKEQEEQNIKFAETIEAIARGEKDIC